MNADKLAKLQEQVRIGGKGTPRRKMKKVSKSAAGDSQKMVGALKKLNAQPIPAIEEVNMFRADGHVLHFVNPKVQAAVAANTFVIGGHCQDKELTELAPGILSQLGPNAIMNLQKMAQVYQQQAAAAGMSLEELAKMAATKGGEDGEDIPDLIKNFETAEINAN
ncbi:Nascent polypeptide-associated complex subunit beta [Paramicrosporidium saccamoebae]|uniref:Nascent polypeptide-associated complex subunit beta n=1 Tax=Paramicrosporidium saccamoebae TaxID=1246581 RepID=A0A2H9TP41_9FUNG|nr:Nascent polypeptide-associated complex subunit beta [Paramicrosporidium saccamoebae]